MKTNRREFIGTIGRGLAGLYCLHTLPGRLFAAEADPAPPNIVLIMTDDLAWSDLACYGNRHHATPRLDQLAAEGMRFTDAYAASAVCSPTRASLLTGQYPARLHLTHIVQHRPPADTPWLEPQIQPYVPLETPVLPRLLTHHTSGHIGKWHLGGHAPALAATTDPLRYGYTVNTGGGLLGQPPDYFSPYRRTVNGRDFTLPALDPGPEDEYLTERLASEAERFIEANRAQPFLLSLSLFTPHTAIGARLQARPELIEKHHDAPNPTYAAMIEHMDQAVGRVLDKLAALDLAADTLVIFTSDNGGFGAVTSNAPWRGAKGTPYEGGHRVPLIVRWPGVVAPGSVSETPVITPDLTATVLAAAGVEARVPDGVNLLPLLSGDEAPDRATIYWHFPHYARGLEPYSALRRGPYKLIEFLVSGTVELYDLSSDPGETRNLAAERPDLVRDLQAALAAWRRQTHAQMPSRRPT